MAESTHPSHRGGHRSLWSRDSLLSVASSGSVLSIGSVGSAASIGSIGSVGSAASIGSALSAASHWSLLSFASNRAISAERTKGRAQATAILAAIAAGALLADQLTRRT